MLPWRAVSLALCRSGQSQLIEPRDEVPAEALGTVGPDDEVLPFGFEPVISLAAGVDPDFTGWIRDVR